jgi:quercetin dioxygenase-like cupin family protein
METLTTGRPLEDGEPTDGPALELDPDGRAAKLLGDAVSPLASSPGLGLWTAILAYPEPEARERPELLVWLAPGASPLPEHVHTERPERFECLRGELTVPVEGDPNRLGPGEAVTVEVGERHTFRNDTDDLVAVRATVPWRPTVDTQFTVCGLDHEGSFARGDGYGEPGFLHGLVTSEAISDGTRIAGAPHALQRVLWATVGRAARATGHRAVDERFLRDEYWERTVEQPSV